MGRTHRDAEQAYGDLNAADDVEGLDDAELDDPIVRTPGDGEAEHVLEDHQGGEGLDGDVAWNYHVRYTF